MLAWVGVVLDLGCREEEGVGEDGCLVFLFFKGKLLFFNILLIFFNRKWAPPQATSAFNRGINRQLTEGMTLQQNSKIRYDIETF